MGDQAEVLEVGRVDRVHGLKGEVVVSLSTNMVDERTSIGARLRVGETWMTISSSRRHQQKWLLRFDTHSSREDVEPLRGKTLFAEPIESDEFVFIHELLGKTLQDQRGVFYGEIVSVIDNPASDLMELTGGQLVPLTFFTSQTDDVVYVDVPDGLLDESEAL